MEQAALISEQLALLTPLVLLLVAILLILGAQVLRRQRLRQLSLRRIPAYRAMPIGVGEAVESERPIHVSFGSSGLGAEATVSALAVADMLYPLAERAAISDQPPIVSLSDPTALPLAQGTLRRAYEMRQNMDAYRSTAARWYPQGPRSLAFAAGVAGALADEDASMSVIGGRFGPELAFIGETATRYDQLFFAQSDQLDGQAVAWVMAERPLIGEELYVAGAYLPARPSALHLSQVLTMEIMRVLAIVGILFFAVFALAQRMLMDVNFLLTVIGGVLLVAAVGMAVVFAIRQLRGRGRA